MFSIPGIISQSLAGESLVTPNTTMLYLRGDSLNDLSTFSRKTIINHTHEENAVSIDTEDSIYGSNASMIFPSATSSYLKYSARVGNVSLGNAPWTIEMWIKRLGADVRMSVLTFLPPSPDGTTYNLQPCLNTFSTGFYFWEHSGTTRVINNITQNTWVHLAICRQSNNTVKMFRNGTEFFSGAYSRNNTSFSELYLGVKAFGTAVESARSSFKLAHFHLATECYYTTNFTADKATGFS